VPPTVTNTPGSNFLEWIESQNPGPYTLSQFTISSGCALSGISIVPVAGGSITDFTSSDGSSLINLLTSHTDLNIQVEIPLITTGEHFFRFLIKAEVGAKEGFTEEIFLKVLSCITATVSPPTIEESINMFSAEYPLTFSSQFTSSNQILCPLSSLSLELTALGTQDDLLSTDGITQVSLLTNFTNP